MTPVAHKEFQDLTSSERGAILSLLEDEDPVVQPLLVDQLVGYGPPVLEWLVPQLADANGVVRQRIEQVRQRLGRQVNHECFLSFCSRPADQIDLEEGIWQLALTEYPSICVDGYRALIDSFAEVLRDRLDQVADGESILTTMNHYLFDELGFSGNEENYFDAENSFFNRVMDRRLGIPISLSILVILLGQRLNLPIQGIGMPGHFLCRYQTDREEFYIDSFNAGKLLSKGECVRFLNGTQFGYRDEFLGPVSNQAILQRVCQNLVHIYSQNEDAQRTERFERYIEALSRKS